MQEFAEFLLNVQNDQVGSDERNVADFIRHYLCDSTRDINEPYFTKQEVSTEVPT